MKALVRVCLGIVVVCAAGARLHAQSQAPTAAPANFEVASVKPSDPGAAGPFGPIPTILPQGISGLTMRNVPLRMLVRFAYGVQDFQIVGGPQWQTSNKFDITARAAEGTTKGTEDLLPLLKGLLADRFKLKAHMETREVPTYALVVSRSDGKLGSDIKPSTSECSGAQAEARKRAEEILKGGPAALASLIPKPGETVKCGLSPVVNPANLSAGVGLHADGISITQLTEMLTQFTGRTVIDKTGLSGLYDWDLRFDPQILLQMLSSQLGINMPNLPTAPGGNSLFADSPSLMTALQEQLGLKLDSQRAPGEVLVIDSAELPQPD